MAKIGHWPSGYPEIIEYKLVVNMYLMNDDTICAPATVPGTGAISVIRVSGGEALPVVSAMVKCAPGREIMMAPGYSVRFGRIFLDDGELLDEVLVTVFRAPHSYTGEDSAEISCHASKYIVDNVLHLLVEAGVRPAEPGEFTRRAYLNGKMDLAQAEAVADLIAAQGAAAHHLALSQLKGGFSNELKKMRGELLNIVSLMELELDFSEEEVEFADRSQLSGLVDAVSGHIGRLISSFRLGNAIRNGIPVAIAGATNTGKSTLLNALLGEDRAIVSDVHGTTRDTIEETLNVGGLLFRFIDTAGIRRTDETVEQIGIERTFRKLEEAVVVFVMVDASLACSMEDGVPGAGFSRGYHADVPDAGFSGDSHAGVPDADFYGGSHAGVPAAGSSEGFHDGVSDADFYGGSHAGVPAAGSGIGDSGNSSDSAVPSGSGDILLSGKDDYAGMTGQYDGAGNGVWRGVEDVLARVDVSRQKVIFVVNKMDRVTGMNAPAPLAIRAGLDRLKASYHLQKSPEVYVSAKKGEGLDDLRMALTEVCAEYAISSDDVMVTNARHIDALKNARTSLARVQDGLRSGLPTDLVSQDIREAIYHIGSIVGEISTDEVLGNIFKNFCIGK